MGGFVCSYQITSHSSRIRTLKSYVVMTSQQYAASTKSRGCGPELMRVVYLNVTCVVVSMCLDPWLAMGRMMR